MFSSQKCVERGPCPCVALVRGCSFRVRYASVKPGETRSQGRAGSIIRSPQSPLCQRSRNGRTSTFMDVLRRQTALTGHHPAGHFQDGLWVRLGSHPPKGVTGIRSPSSSGFGGQSPVDRRRQTWQPGRATGQAGRGRPCSRAGPAAPDSTSGPRPPCGRLRPRDPNAAGSQAPAPLPATAT